MTAYLAHNHPTGIRFDSAISFGVRLAQCKNVPEHFHLDFSEPMSSNGTSATTATLRVPAAKVGSSDVTLGSAITATQEHDAAAAITFGTAQNGEFVKFGPGRNVTATSGGT